jgi:hypothetical protein
MEKERRLKREIGMIDPSIVERKGWWISGTTMSMHSYDRMLMR